VKLYIGGKQARPDSGYSIEVRGLNDQLLGESPLGNRKDIRNAVEAARRAEAGQDDRAQSCSGAFLHRGKSLATQRGDRAVPFAAVGAKQAEHEVKASIERLFSYAAWTDKLTEPFTIRPSATLPSP